MYNRLVTDYLEATAARLPDKAAFSDTQNTITWRELLETSKRWARVISQNFKRGQGVPVMCEKNVQTVQLFFACVYAGCFYSYFDASFPEARIQSMMKTLNAEMLVADSKAEKRLSKYEKQIKRVHIEDFDKMAEGAQDKEGSVFDAPIDTDIVYALFTSGSTGEPKAVVVSHRSIVDFIPVFVDLFGITADDRIANQAPFDFDVSVKDIFSAVFTGASCHLVPKMYFSMPARLIDFLIEREVTSLCWAVSAVCIISTLGGFEYKVPSSIKRVMFSGEVMPVKQLAIWREHLPNAMYVNLYGPTEITCNCTYHIITDKDKEQESIPIGIPFPNERVFILDEDNKEITAEETDKRGELCVSGTCVADGYYNSLKTSEVFVQNPLQSVRLERVYLTGDAAWYGKDGLLRYGGRKDTQIKHMGHRIELGEIDERISCMEGIDRAVCVFTNNKITAFYVSGAEVPNKVFVTHLKTMLPAYMVPSCFVRIDFLPLTKNGKVDRRALEEKTFEERK